jgi:predicted RNA-binding protein YlxR (DUF448 family)
MAKPRHVPERTCVACGQKQAKRELIRIVRTPQGAVTADPSGKSPGRGTYLCPSAACWERAIHKGGLERGLHTHISASDRDQLLAFCHQHVTGPAAPGR